MASLTPASIVVLVIVFVLLALAILFICQHGGWQGGCTGNCAACHSKCSSPKQPEKKDGEDENNA